MPSSVPVYNLQAFPRHESNQSFYMTRLERLVTEFSGIDQPHSHTFYLIMWITQGSGTHTIDFRTYTVGPHQLYFLTPGQIHSWQLAPDTQGFNLFFEPGFFRARYGNRLSEYPFYHSHQHRPLLEVTHQQDLFRDLFVHSYGEYEQHQPNRSDVFLSFVHILLENASRQYVQEQVGDHRYLFDRIRQYEELIETQYVANREIRTYATQMGVTPNYLNHICQQVLRKTASQLLHERVIIEAQRLLTHTPQSVKEIAFQLGFEDPSYFVRYFKKHTDITPEGFRQQQAQYR